MDHPHRAQETQASSWVVTCSRSPDTRPGSRAPAHRLGLCQKVLSWTSCVHKHSSGAWRSYPRPSWEVQLWMNQLPAPPPCPPSLLVLSEVSALAVLNLWFWSLWCPFWNVRGLSGTHTHTKEPCLYVALHVSNASPLLDVWVKAPPRQALWKQWQKIQISEGGIRVLAKPCAAKQKMFQKTFNPEGPFRNHQFSLTVSQVEKQEPRREGGVVNIAQDMRLFLSLRALLPHTLPPIPAAHPEISRHMKFCVKARKAENRSIL